MATVKIQSPKMELCWVTISGKGKANMSGTLQYVASGILDASIPAHQAFIDEVNAYWEDNKPAKFNKAPKSTGIYPYTEKDKDGNKVEVPGKFVVAFKTGIAYPDGTAKIIDVYNAKAKKVSLGTQTIGNGSVGFISGAMGVYENRNPTTKAILDAGVTLYLDAIQLTKFVPYSADAGFNAVEDEDGWTGEEEFEGVTEAPAAQTSGTVRL